MIIMRTISRSFIIAETIVKVWAELLVEWVVNIDTKVSVKLWDLQDTRAKKTSTGQWTKKEAPAQNIYKNLHLSQYKYMSQKFNLINTNKFTLNRIKEVYKLFTIKGEEFNNQIFLRISKDHTELIQHRDIDNINNKPESYKHFTKN